MTRRDESPRVDDQTQDAGMTELADRQALTLESLLAILRSEQLDDRAARTLAVQLAAASLVDIRTTTDQHFDTVLEPVTGAFERLRSDLRPLARFSDLDIQFVEPPASGRALPGGIARAARGIVRSAVLASVDSSETRRVRVQWDCDGLNLLIGIRDDGRGQVTAKDDSLRPITERVTALDGHLQVASTPGWGTELSISIPLDAPAEPHHLSGDIALSPREQEVLHLVTSGERNKDIAGILSISENTVKFHVANLLRKTGTRTRTELTALAR